MKLQYLKGINLGPLYARIDHNGERPERIVTLKCSTPKAQSSVPFLYIKPLLHTYPSKGGVWKIASSEKGGQWHPNEGGADRSAPFESLGEFSGEYHIHTDPNGYTSHTWLQKNTTGSNGQTQNHSWWPVTNWYDYTDDWTNTKKLWVCLDPSDLNKAIKRALLHSYNGWGFEQTFWCSQCQMKRIAIGK